MTENNIEKLKIDMKELIPKRQTMKNDVVGLKERIKEERLNKGYSQETFAKLVGIGRSSMCHVEDLGGKTSYAICKKVCDALNIDIKDYIFDKCKLICLADEEIAEYRKNKSAGQACENFSIERVFEEYEEDFNENFINFSGSLKKCYMKKSDERIFEVIDGGMKYKRRKLKRKGTKIEGFIEHYFLKEIDEMIKEDRMKGKI